MLIDESMEAFREEIGKVLGKLVPQFNTSVLRVAIQAGMHRKEELAERNAMRLARSTSRLGKSTLGLSPGVSFAEPSRSRSKSANSPGTSSAEPSRSRSKPAQTGISTGALFQDASRSRSKLSQPRLSPSVSFEDESRGRLRATPSGSKAVITSVLPVEELAEEGGATGQ